MVTVAIQDTPVPMEVDTGATPPVPPVELLFGKRLKPNLSETVRSKMQVQKEHHDVHTEGRSFKVNDLVYVKARL